MASSTARTSAKDSGIDQSHSRPGLGTAAAKALDQGQALTEVDIPSLQRCLQRDGVYLKDISTGPHEK